MASHVNFFFFEVRIDDSHDDLEYFLGTIICSCHDMMAPSITEHSLEVVPLRNQDK